MRLLFPVLGLLGAANLAPHAAQAAPRPQPYCIRDVALDRAGEHRGTLILRDGVIAAVLDAAAPAPPGTRVIEGAGLICLPAFLDTFTRQGCTVPQPVPDRDLPPNVLTDVGIDMRLANRKGIEPGFRAVEALAIKKEQGEAWRKSGFGAALVAPGGELLSGASTLASVREAAMRDVVVKSDVFGHAAFTATGAGYPSTLMGYFAQLRQFFLDSQRQIELEQRYEQGRPGGRPPFDADLDAGAALVSGRRTLVCEANSAADIERWFRLADEFGLKLEIAGGIEAWRVRDELARRGVTVALTLEWPKEVKDPRPKKEEAKEPPKEGAPEPEAGAAQEGEAKAASASQAPTESVEKTAETAEKKDAATAAAEPDEKAWDYEEPYAVRLERRRKWEEQRDCALRLQERDVPFVFGSGLAKPSELLEHVRTLVEVGLPAESALAALTRSAAEFLGVERRLGQVAPGFDATFTLWRSDPLVDKEASAAWVFVDGFPSEFKPEKKAKKGAGPKEGVDPTGSWTIAFVAQEEGIREGTLALAMEKDGTLSGTLEVDNPMGGARVKSDVKGQVSGDELELECTLSFGQFTIGTTLTATIAADALEGDGSFTGPWGDQPMKQTFTAKRTPG